MNRLTTIFRYSCRWILMANICFAGTVSAQEQPSLLSRAETHFALQEYAPAAALYERILRKKNNLPLLEKLATSYRGLNLYQQAAATYARIIQQPEASVENWLYYGDMLKSQGDYAGAKTAYNTYREKGGASPLTANRIAGCDSALVWQQQPSGVMIYNMASLNSGGADWGAALYHKSLVFVSDSMRKEVLFATSRRNKRFYARNEHAYLKLYSAAPSINGWGYVNDFSPVINQYRYHVGPAVFSGSGDTAYVTVTDPFKIPFDKGTRLLVYGVRRLELLVFVKKNNQWQPPQPFPYNKPQEYSLGQAVLSADGTTIYFTSDMPGGQGSTDIWFCRRIADGSWGTPQNCGSQLNTAGAEEFPTIGGDGQLYFSSMGHIGMGGFDLFRAVGSGDQWGTPVNLYPPFNSPGDDFYYVSTADGKGFLSSNRSGGKGGDDLYSLALPATMITPVTVQPLLRIPFEATICTDQVCVYLYNKKRDMGWCFMPQPPERKITATLEADTEYVIRVYAGGRLISSTDFNTNGLTGAEVLRKEICPGARK
ncbi:tetratricopeptide repeat protein [Chitinophaga pendula]|uniref:tetratricopeptide repeat protein n=1 Tax=Chitinophaga TaxID=79328 RepID=UPI000BB076AD|nr:MULTISPECIES: tetratricopeptide repeat protein [Chitinophaga]ASZ10868.1 hypothetical protein CK934_07695 [Chitinophaga sp. MD30]UCJ06149.1 tetratricopeptide repeat protein [Chitinophaga pendula]